MKKVLIVHFGNWFSERDMQHYQMEIDTLSELLTKSNIQVDRFEHMPSVAEISSYDAIIFISISFKKDAKKIKSETEKPVFLITGLPEIGDDAFGVIPLEKKLGHHVSAKTISEKLNGKAKFLICTAPDGVANRDQLDWCPMPDDMYESFDAFLSEKPARKAILEKGGIITINRFGGMLTENVKLA